MIYYFTFREDIAGIGENLSYKFQTLGIQIEEVLRLLYTEIGREHGEISIKEVKSIIST